MKIIQVHYMRVPVYQKEAHCCILLKFTNKTFLRGIVISVGLTLREVTRAGSKCSQERYGAAKFGCLGICPEKYVHNHSHDLESTIPQHRSSSQAPVRTRGSSSLFMTSPLFGSLCHGSAIDIYTLKAGFLTRGVRAPIQKYV